MFRDENIGFIGGGNMGEALIRGLIAASLMGSDKISVYDASSDRTDYLEREYRIKGRRNIGEIAEVCSIIVLAVKPQVILQVLHTLRSHLSRKPLVISIAAGIALSMLEGNLPEGTPVIRVMPNATALVQKGASALARGKSVSDEQMKIGMVLFNAVGKAVQVDEKLMNAVTGLSGSAPAYILLVIEALIDAGVYTGLSRDIARDLVVQTVIGTSTMLEITGKHPAELKDMVTSPGGTTIHGLQVLELRSVRGALIECVEAATKRSAELGKG